MRYHLEKRSGIWAVFDTHHPKYDRDAAGCSSHHAGCIAAWSGHPVYEYHPDTGKSYHKYWDMSESNKKQAEELLKLLNNQEQELATLRAKAEAFDKGVEMYKFFNGKRCVVKPTPICPESFSDETFICRPVRVCEMEVEQ